MTAVGFYSTAYAGSVAFVRRDNQRSTPSIAGSPMTTAAAIRT
jgi:hypothetical protein